MWTWIADQKFTVGIVMGVVFGIAARLTMLRTDYRQYPTYPHGKIIHLSLGVIAAGLGAVAVPSLLEKKLHGHHVPGHGGTAIPRRPQHGTANPQQNRQHGACPPRIHLY